MKVEKKTIRFLLNKEITFPKIFLLGKEEERIGIVLRDEAFQKAKEANLDLFCISPQADPPVCQLGDYQKYLYQLKKKAKSNVKKNLLKEVGITFHISEGDLQTKIKKIENWLNEGYTVKISLIMLGREKEHKDFALEKCQKIISYLQNQSAKIQLKKDIQPAKNNYHFLLYKKK